MENVRNQGHFLASTLQMQKVVPLKKYSIVRRARWEPRPFPLEWQRNERLHVLSARLKVLKARRENRTRMLKRAKAATKIASMARARSAKYKVLPLKCTNHEDLDLDPLTPDQLFRLQQGQCLTLKDAIMVWRIAQDDGFAKNPYTQTEIDEDKLYKWIMQKIFEVAPRLLIVEWFQLTVDTVEKFLWSERDTTVHPFFAAAWETDGESDGFIQASLKTVKGLSDLRRMKELDENKQRNVKEMWSYIVKYNVADVIDSFWEWYIPEEEEDDVNELPQVLLDLEERPGPPRLRGRPPRLRGS